MVIRAALIGILAIAAGLFAQGPGAGRGPRGRFVGAQPGMPGRVVKGAPYSADVVTETTQTLSDGNHIRQTSTVRVYRDSEGRTRREESLHSLSGAANANLPQIVIINDPVGGANYALNTNDKTATKSTWRNPGGGPPGGRLGPGGMDRPNRPQIAGVPRGRGDQNTKREALGRQTIEGVQADGTRTTMTIPAGQMGNEQAIVITNEVWYSPELQTVVMAKHTDPRNGETVTRLSNVSRAEPASTMFSVPPEYKVTEGFRRGQPANSAGQ
jgi:hypothetical protein